MRKHRTWTAEKKRRVFHMLDRDMPISQIASLMGVTSNAILGLKFREYKGENVRKVVKKPLSAVEKRLVSEGTHWHRKCLKCRKDRVLERNTFICPPCKESPVFSSMA